MVQLWIDDTAVEVPEGATVLDAARTAGIDIPALCRHPDFPPNTSCMCCLVRIDGSAPLPSCATVAREGMRVESESASLRDLRRTGLELLLGDHAGDCRAPCEHTCPARMDIPDMLRHVVAGDYQAAIAVVKQDIALPAILGRVCPEVCEAACRRGAHDSPASICRIKRFVADQDLASEVPYRPPVAAPSGRRVAVIGGGPTGLAAAYYLAQRGHACTIYDAQNQLGGRLWREFPSDQLPPTVLEGEIRALLATGIAVRTDERIDTSAQLEELARTHDAVLLSTGRPVSGWPESVGLKATSSGVAADSATRQTNRLGVFAAGNVVRAYSLVVQSVAEGKFAAECIDATLASRPLPDRRRAFESRLQRMTAGELCDFCAGEPERSRMEDRLLDSELSELSVRREASRCLHCDCSALGHCKLHHYAEAYDCDARRFAGDGQRFRGRITGQHVTLEIGKCICCGICVQIADATPDAKGIAVLGRSTAIRIAPPPGVTLDEAFGSAARRCAEACPTGAISVHPH